VHVSEAALLDGVDQQFEGDALEPADVMFLGTPARLALPGVPEAIRRDADAL
jgi:hypothetical protein